MKAAFQKIDTMIEPLRKVANCIGAPLFDLSIRLYMAKIFFTSGWLKFENYLNGDWGSTVEAFTDYHPIPGVDPNLAAISGTAGELILPVLLAFGLFGRFAAAGLLVMTIVIQYIVPAEYELQNPQHYFWMFLFMSLILRGPGKLSIDHLIIKWLRK